MFEVTFIKEIKNVEEKFVANLTKRQIGCVVAGVVICVPVYVYLKPLIGKELSDWIIVAVGLISGLLGWYKKNGMYFEEYAKVMLDYRFLVNQKRTCRFQTESEKQIEELYQKKLSELENIKRKGTSK